MDEEIDGELHFRVKAGTPCSKLGSSVARGISDGKVVVMKAIGAGAVNQAVKAFPIAQSFVASYGIELNMKAHFFPASVPEGETQGVAIRVFKV